MRQHELEYFSKAYLMSQYANFNMNFHRANSFGKINIIPNVFFIIFYVGLVWRHCDRLNEHSKYCYPI